MGGEARNNLMVEFYFFLIVGLSLVLFFSVQFFISLRGKGSTLSKIWAWIKNVLDAISGIG
jgi:hypothetical protein